MRTSVNKTPWYFRSSLESGLSVGWDFLSGSLGLFLAFALTPYAMDALPPARILLMICFISGFAFALASKLVGIASCRYHMPVNFYDLTISSVLAAILSISFTFGSFYFLYYVALGRYIVLLAILFTACLGFVPRALLFRYYPFPQINLAIFGTGYIAQRLYYRLTREDTIFCPALVLGMDHAACSGTTSFGDLPIKPLDPSSLISDLKEHNVEGVILCVENDEDIPEEWQRTFFHLPLHRIQILNKGSFVEKYYQEISVEYLNLHWVTSFFALYAPPHAFLLKRMLDITLALIGGFLYLLLLPFIALAIKLDSPGPVFYSQTRVGRFSDPFTIYKLRSMTHNAEKDGAQWATKNDARVTRVGRWLRSSRLDEFPQLYNVLLGQMSIVGPRPERPEFEVELIQSLPLYERRHMVAPGLTGWAQVRYGYGSSIEDAKTKLQYDLYYIKHLSILLDLRIILMTLPSIWRGSR